jgi:Fe2+ or Zn2+ uptake regulation protein
VLLLLDADRSFEWRRVCAQIIICWGSAFQGSSAMHPSNGNTATTWGWGHSIHDTLLDEKVGCGILDANICNNKGLQMACGQQMEEELRGGGFRVTPQRAVILETIAHMDGHHSVNDVFERAKERLPGLHLVTVYRTLDTLQRAGMIDLLSASGDAMRFSLRDQSNEHGHLRCRICGDSFEFPVRQYRPMIDKIEHQYQFKVDSDHITLEGTCENCTGDDTERRATSKPE